MSLTVAELFRRLDDGIAALERIADALERLAEPAAVTPVPEDDRPGPDWQAIP